jgi:cell division protein FtsI (penicillin-binding protein 3)
VHSPKQYRWRFYLIILGLLVLLGILIARLIDLNVLQRSFLLKQGQARVLRKVTIPSYRGMITDRNGEPLAISAPVDSIWMNPKIFEADHSQIEAMSKLLHLPPEMIEREAKWKNKEFVYLKRLVTPDVATEVLELKNKGIFAQKTFKRYYPQGEVTSHIVGVTNVDDQGQEGLEFAYNEWLGGKSGQKEVLKDRLGNVISEVALLRKPHQGRNLTLSIDNQIQYLAYRSLKEAVDNFHAESGSIVVLNIKTGEILAMVNQPSYNPNAKLKGHDARYRNRAATDSFEPGSVIKPFTVVMALESGKYTMKSLINTSPGWMRIGGFKISDDTLNGEVDLTKLLQRSSNIGAAKIMLSLEPNNFYQLLKKFGFGDRTDSGFPGEARGTLLEHPVWYPSVIATLAYGYGIAATTLQLAHAYAILGNDGVSVPVTFLKSDTTPTGTRVIQRDVAKKLLTMLQAVVEGDGAGAVLAQVPGYHVAGKTGTAYIAGPGGYDRHKYMSSFVGVAPATNPQIVVAIDIRDPKGHHFAAQVSAPVFSKVMGGVLRILNIPPDKR